MIPVGPLSRHKTWQMSCPPQGRHTYKLEKTFKKHGLDRYTYRENIKKRGNTVHMRANSNKERQNIIKIKKRSIIGWGTMILFR